MTIHKDVPLPTWIELSLIDVCNRKCTFCPKVDEKVAPDTYQKMTRKKTTQDEPVIPQTFTKKDFINSLKFLNEFGMIILHDTDPMEERLIEPRYCSDSYKIDTWVRENYTELDIMTLPISEAGLSLVTRKKDKRVNKFIKND